MNVACLGVLGPALPTKNSPICIIYTSVVSTSVCCVCQITRLGITEKQLDSRHDLPCIKNKPKHICIYVYIYYVLYVIFFFADLLATGRGALRLVRNNFYSTVQAWNSGIVEIFYGNIWGNICDDAFFALDEADVICHQLGYTGASSYGNTGTITSYVVCTCNYIS